MSNHNPRRWTVRMLATALVGSSLALVSSGLVTAQDKGGDLCTPPQRQHVVRNLQGTPALVEAGRQTFGASCASCHGADGRATGPQAARLDPKPTNLREGLKVTSAAGLYARLTTGHTSVEVPPLDSEARWALAHFIRAEFVPPARQNDSAREDFSAACDAIVPPEPVVCKTEVKRELQSKLATTPEQLQKGKAAYEGNCGSCHGNSGVGDGPAAIALNPRPRNFTKETFKAGSSAFALFNTVTRGLAGTAMPGFENLTEEERWATVHYVRETFIPKENRQEATPEQIAEICVELSRPPKPPEIPIEVAMEALIADQEELRTRQLGARGAVRLNKTADEGLGASVYGALCQSCHGDAGAGVADLGRYGRFPFVTLSTRALTNQAASGTWREFAERLTSIHYTLPETASTGILAEQDLKGLQAFLAKSLRRVAPIESDEPRMTPVALLSASPTGELLFFSGRVYHLAHPPAAQGEGKLQRIEDYLDFKRLYTGAAPLPDAQPEEGVSLQAVMGLDCLREPDELGQRAFCTSTTGANSREIAVTIKLAFTAPAPAEGP